MQRDFLKSLITPTTSSRSTARRPLGQHSEALERVLIYFRRQPPDRQVCDPGAEGILRLPHRRPFGARGVAPRLVEDSTYPSADEAYHALFMRRVQDLLES